MTLGLGALGLVACAGSDGDVEGKIEPIGDASKGEQLFTEKGCVNCHRIEGTEIGDNPVNLVPGRQPNLQNLRNKIDADMPAANPDECTGSCADDIAQYIWDNGDKSSKSTSMSLNSATISYQEAEDLVGTSGYALPDSWMLNNLGYISAAVDFPAAGQYTLAVRAWTDRDRAEAVNMEFELDGNPVKTFQVKDKADNPGFYLTQIHVAYPGIQIFSVWLKNDNNLPAVTATRNLFVDWLIVSGPSQVLASN